MEHGLKDKPLPRGFERLVVRMPIILYRTGLGFLLGDRFLMLIHKGRKSGRSHRVVLEVVQHDLINDRYYIASGWGEKSNWYQNIINNPNVKFQVKNRKYDAYATRVDKEETTDVLFDYATRNPGVFSMLSRRIIGQRLEPTKVDCMLMADYVPVVVLNKMSL